MTGDIVIGWHVWSTEQTWAVGLAFLAGYGVVVTYLKWRFR